MSCGAFCTPTKAMDKLLVLGSVSLSGTLLAGVTALICRGLKGKISARAVYVLWILVLLRFLCPWTTSHSLLNQAVEAPQESWTLTVPEQTGSPAAEPVSPRTSPVTTTRTTYASGTHGYNGKKRPQDHLHSSRKRWKCLKINTNQSF